SATQPRIHARFALLERKINARIPRPLTAQSPEFSGLCPFLHPASNRRSAPRYTTSLASASLGSIAPILARPYRTAVRSLGVAPRTTYVRSNVRDYISP